MLTTDQLRDNWQSLLDRVRGAAQRAGRDPNQIQVMAVTKTQPLAVVRMARDVGIMLLGENRVQEAESKYTRNKEDKSRVAVNGEQLPRLELIGHLQRNKARQAAALFASVQSIDKLSTASELSKHSKERSVPILLEINTSGEETKFGYRDEERMMADLEEMARLPGIQLSGLMTIAPFTREEGPIRKSFQRLRELRDRLSSQYPQIKTLSMGMSGDFEIAIEEGATMIRVGSVIFGPRGTA
jgi:pyridoxal phosphate enzyme (YggS family)